MNAHFNIETDELQKLAAETAARHAKSRAFVAPKSEPFDWDAYYAKRAGKPFDDTEFQAWRDLPAEWLFRGEAAYREALENGRA